MIKLILLACMFSFSGCQSGHKQRRELPPEQTFRLCLIGDTGKDSPTQKLAADALAQEKCHGVYILGDVIYPNGLVDVDDPQAESKFFKYYRPLTQVDHSPPLHILLGNHDYQGDPDAWIDLAKEVPILYAPSRYYFQDFSGICITSLDTNLSSRTFEYPRQKGEEKWLDEINDKTKKHCQLKIALGHHPYRSSGEHGHAKKRLRNFLEEDVIGTYDYYISGHDHILSYEGTSHGTELFISGAGGTPDKNERPGYIVMDIQKKNGLIKVNTRLKRAHSDTSITEQEYEKSFRTRI